MSRLLPLAVVSLLALPAAAQALPVVGGVTGITAGVTGGTLGVGPEIEYRANPLFGVRASATFLGFSGDGDVGSYDYDGKVRLRSFGGTVDLHPLLNGFRLSAGVRATGGNRIRFRGRANQPQTYGGVTYTPEQAGTLSGRIRTRDVSPLVSIGYAKTWLSGFTAGVDGGVMFHGRPKVRDLVATGQLATNPAAQPEYQRQMQRLRDRVNDYPLYPVAQLSLGYRF